MSNTEELQPIEILTDDQLGLLDDDSKKAVVLLTENLNQSSLQKLNPLVTTLLELKEEAFKLELKPKDAKGKFDKDNIAAYKDLKSRAGKYRAAVKSTASEMKRPLIDVKSGIIVIEKTFTNVSLEINEALDKEFKPYLDEEEAKKAAAQKKKDDALNAKVNEVENEKNAALAKMEATNNYNKLKYELITETLVTKVANHIANSNEDVIRSYKDEMIDLSFDKLIENNKIDMSVSSFDFELLAELKALFETNKKNALSLLVGKLDALKLNRENIGLRSVNNPVVVDHSFVSAHTENDDFSRELAVNTHVANSRLSDEQFLEHILTNSKNLFALVELRLKLYPDSSPKLYMIKSILEPIKELQ